MKMVLFILRETILQLSERHNQISMAHNKRIHEQEFSFLKNIQ